MNTRRIGKFVLIIGASLATWACSESSPPSVEIKVKGYVTLEGKRVTGGRISFEPLTNDDQIRDATARVGEIDKKSTSNLLTLSGNHRLIVEGGGVPAN